MKALSGRQPWWWAILHAGKRIENRHWNTHHRGPILLHAAKGGTRSEIILGLNWMTQRGLIQYEQWPGLENVMRGGIVGRARIVEVVAPGTLLYPAGVDSRGHDPEKYGFVLEDVEPLPFRPLKGALGLFEVAP